MSEVTVEQIIEGLSFIPGTNPNDTHIVINHGPYKGIVFKFGRVWFPDENEPVMSFDYDVVSEQKPEPLEPFLNFIGIVLQNLLRKAVDEQTAIYTGGTEVKQGIVEETVEETTSIFQPPVMNPNAILTPWSYKLPEPEPGTTMSRNLLEGL